MTGDKITEWVLLGTGLAWFAWECVIVLMRSSGHRWATISMVLQRRGWQFNVIPWGFGTLAGHWWWNQPNTRPIWGEPWIYVALVVLTMGVIASDALYAKNKDPLKHINRPFWRNPTTWLMAGILAGHFLWPQRAGL